MEGKMPGELKPASEKLRAFRESAGSDFRKYGDGQFEELMKPVQDWIDKNCTSREPGAFPSLRRFSQSVGARR